LFGSDFESANIKNRPTSKSASVLTENSSLSCTSVTAGRRNFKDYWCKELMWISSDQNSGVANCKVCTSFPRISDQNAKIVKRFPGPLKLETLKKHVSQQCTVGPRSYAVGHVHEKKWMKNI
jgi:hypothetical protein